MLKVVGNQIVNDNGTPVRLTGVNCAGLEWDSRDTAIVEHVAAAMDQWNAKLVRLPISQDRWFGFGKEQQETQNFVAYRETVDQIIAVAEKRQKFILFELHWNDLGTFGENIGQHKMPDLNSVVFWRDVALRYKNHPNVLFGLYNEPRDVSWEIWKNGGEVEEDNIKYMAVGMQQLVQTVRDTGANNILVIGGLDWGYTFEGMIEAIGDITDTAEGNGIVFDCHIYPWKRLDWDLDITVIKHLHPVLIGEFGHYGDEAKPREGEQCMKSDEWMPRLMTFLEKHGYHYTAWDFHIYAGPCLIKNWDYEPTPYFGEYVKKALAKE